MAASIRPRHGILSFGVVLVCAISMYRSTSHSKYIVFCDTYEDYVIMRRSDFA